VRDTWNISADWELHAELVFGTPAAPAGEKTFKPILGERLLVFGGDKQ
jgi:predicted oxidoreductase (fatty acid repression mutant protein)